MSLYQCCSSMLHTSILYVCHRVKASILEIISGNICQVRRFILKSSELNFNQLLYFYKNHFFVKIPFIMMFNLSTPWHMIWFVAKSFGVVNFKFGTERENIWLKFDLTTTYNTRHRKTFKILVFLYYTKTRNVKFIMLSIVLCNYIYLIPKYSIIWAIWNDLQNIDWQV